MNPREVLEKTILKHGNGLVFITDKFFCHFNCKIRKKRDKISLISH